MIHGFEEGGKLSEVDARGWFAVCYVCKVVYEDDVLGSSPITCPHCRGVTLTRGLRPFDIMKKQTPRAPAED